MKLADICVNGVPTKTLVAEPIILFNAFFLLCFFFGIALYAEDAIASDCIVGTMPKIVFAVDIFIYQLNLIFHFLVLELMPQQIWRLHRTIQLSLLLPCLRLQEHIPMAAMYRIYLYFYQ